MSEQQILVDEIMDGHHVQFDSNGVFRIDGEIAHWYTKPNGTPWIPQKRSSIRGLIKQILRDD